MSEPGDRFEQLPLPRGRMRRVWLTPLGRDITLVLVIKFAALALLWWAFFSHPGPRQTSIGAPPVAAHLVPPVSSKESAHVAR